LKLPPFLKSIINKNPLPQYGERDGIFVLERELTARRGTRHNGLHQITTSGVHFYNPPNYDSIIKLSLGLVKYFIKKKFVYRRTMKA